MYSSYEQQHMDHFYLLKMSKQQINAFLKRALYFHDMEFK